MPFGIRHLCPFDYCKPPGAVATKFNIITSRWQSSYAQVQALNGVNKPNLPEPRLVVKSASPLSRASNWSLVRNVLLSTVLTRPLLFRPALSVMQKIANSKSKLLNPDTNPLLRALIKPIIYDQFCAGRTKDEILNTIRDVRKLGFAGVILCYVKEIQLTQDRQILGSQGHRNADIQAWLDGTLKTLDMLGEEDWLGLKYTGAGQIVTEALVRSEDPPAEFAAAMRTICEKAREKNCRLWVDAEQQIVQPTIDKWTIPLMREFNRSHALVHTTVQAYLKESKAKLDYQIDLARDEGWKLGVKLVRGAYIANDIRELIHDTKSDTDASYNGLVHDLLTGRIGLTTSDGESCVRLFLAGHNPETVRTTLHLARGLSERNELKVYPEFGQLQGMADDLGAEIIEFGEHIPQQHALSMQKPFIPKAYKCLHWGTLQECMQYLVRRAIENSAAVGRMRDNATAARKELFRRAGFGRYIT